MNDTQAQQRHMGTGEEMMEVAIAYVFEKTHPHRNLTDVPASVLMAKRYFQDGDMHNFRMMVNQFWPGTFND